MLGFESKTSRNALETSLHGQTKRSVCVGSDLSDHMKLGIGFTQETAEKVISPLLSVYIIELLALFTFYTRILCVVW